MGKDLFYGTIEHSGFAVPDLEAAIRFFTEVLGFKLLFQAEPQQKDDDSLRDYFGVHPRSVAYGAFLEYGGKKIELVQWDSPDNREIALKPSEAGCAHLAITVKDLQAAAAYLAQQPGVRVRAFCPLGFVYAVTPWGMEIQLLEKIEF